MNYLGIKNHKCFNKVGRFLWSFLLILVAFTFSTCQSEKSKLPNIVIIFIDDMGYADVSCFGATDYATPQIDRLAEEGMRFTSFYASQAVCSASRGSLLSGCYSERIGIYGALHAYSNVGISSQEVLIPEMLKEKGYATGIFGKWHLGHQQEFLPLQHGFDEYVGLPYSNDMWPVGFDGTPIEENGDHSYPPLMLYEGNQAIDTISDLENQGQLTTIYTEKAVEFINKHQEEPFFLYLPHSMVHVPIAVSDKFKGKSGQGLFADVMMELDWSVGEILKALEENGLTDNTLVIFTSDNGPWLNFGKHAGSAFPLREGKGAMWEGGPRVSTLMKWPAKIPAGISNHHLASTLDILPTLSEITGASLPTNKIDGISMLPLILGEESAPTREQFYYYYMGDLIAVRKNNWKLVFPHKYRSYLNEEPGIDGFPGPTHQEHLKEMELYDLSKDISEEHNVIALYPELVEELMIIGDSARIDLGDRLENIKGENVRLPGRIRMEQDSIKHLAIDKKITIYTEYAVQYSGEGDQTIINGALGSLDYSDRQWLGFEGQDFKALIDLETKVEVKEITCGFLLNQKSWIFTPDSIIISISEDGKNYKTIKSFGEGAVQQKKSQRVIRYQADMEPSQIRYVKIEAKNIGECPAWHSGAGSKAWLFVDEIVIK